MPSPGLRGGGCFIFKAALPQGGRGELFSFKPKPRRLTAAGFSRQLADSCPWGQTWRRTFEHLRRDAHFSWHWITSSLDLAAHAAHPSGGAASIPSRKSV